MPKIARTTGSSMTKRGVIEYDWSEPGDADGQARAAIEINNQSQESATITLADSGSYDSRFALNCRPSPKTKIKSADPDQINCDPSANQYKYSPVVYSIAP